MTTLLSYLIIGVVTGSIYAIAATGLVVTYTTSRIFNFAHGAAGMVIAFSYWQMRVAWHWPTLLALAVALLLLGPMMGILFDVLAMRHLQRVSVTIRLMATLSLFTALEGLALYIWGVQLRALPSLWGERQFKVAPSLNMTWDQVTVILLSICVAIGLRIIFRYTRMGVTMRAVVDDPGLAQLNGVVPGRVTSFSWALGTTLAGLAAILIAPTISLDISQLSLLVVAAYAAAIVGGLSSVPWTFAGAMGLGVAVSLCSGYLPPASNFTQTLIPSLPFIVLVVVLIIMRQERDTLGGYEPVPEPVASRPIVWLVVGVACIVTTVLIAPTLSSFNALVVGTGLLYAALLLSLVLVTGMGGQISLAQFSFLGIGAVFLGHLAKHMAYVPAAILATFLTGVVGVLIALPSLRLKGLYLALSTLGFALLMDNGVFPNSHVIGVVGTQFTVPVPNLAGHRLTSVNSQIDLFVVVVVLYAVGILMIRRSRFGRALTAMRDSPVAASALGMSLVRAKVAVFFISASMAGFAGCLYGGLQQQIGTSYFTYMLSLTALLILAIQGVNSIPGAIVGAFFYALFFLLLPRWISNPDTVQAIQPLAIALGVVNLARHPEGAMAQQLDIVRGLVRRRTREESTTPRADELVRLGQGTELG